MKKTWLALTLITLPPGGRADQTIQYPDQTPMFFISFPDDWEVKTGDESVSASSADERVNMELIALESEAQKSAVDLAKQSLSKELEGLKWTSDPEKGEINGMDVTFINGQVTLEEVKMAVNCAVFAPPGEDTFFMLFNIIPMESLADHEADVLKILNSVKGRKVGKVKSKGFRDVSVFLPARQNRASI